MADYQVKDDRERLANKIKELTATTMYLEGYLTEGQLEDFCSRYAVVFRTKGWFGSMLGKFLGEPDDNNICIELVKFINTPDAVAKQPNLKVIPFKKEDRDEDTTEDETDDSA